MRRDLGEPRPCKNEEANRTLTRAVSKNRVFLNLKGLGINNVTWGEHIFLSGDLHWLAWLAMEIGISRESLACDMVTLEAPFCRLQAGTGEDAMLVVIR